MSDYNSKLKSEEMDFLFKVILSLETLEECYSFFEDICTVNEINAMKQRLHVAKLLMERRTYLDIAATTGASTATISRVNRALNYGTKGYKTLFERVSESEKSKKEEI